ncbi:MAG TPA: hypothetical protein VKQ11_18835 [Candidatus Sulfotelmatobacter sp.]|nr:hypothetical protein [Candidatus Sulfotelmatobacter sp.]
MPDGPTPKSHPILEWDPTAPEPAFPDPHSPTFARDFKSFVRKILLASPYFPIFYADVLIDRAPNSNAAKILRKSYPEILQKVNMAAEQQKSSRSCTHIKVTGVRCGSPSLHGEQFCYFHRRMHRGVRTPPQARLHPVALIEDEESIQAALMEVINALMRNTLDLKRAGLILRALHIAVKNARRVRFDYHGTNSTREVPAYPDQNAAASSDAPSNAGTDAIGGPGREAAVPSHSAEQQEIAAAMSIPFYDPSASQPPRVRTTAELIAQGLIRPHNSTPAERSREYKEMVAKYFGYPSVEAYEKAEAGTAAPANSRKPPTPVKEQAQKPQAIQKGAAGTKAGRN